ncbi:DUF3153 domain-containing protein [Spirulina sp. CS-785/01]|uniref:DUF3153 domain-containing protein n=1 Tax=Spirulina sp. CS-785/01 TaxID=3021716 RepID=UPI00232FF3D4|nr:DUF3153 domain-containing protein [Spirulina sp. CS-785/01]MDB9314424.1 DUF3153 domain-containing protein [Spirulina sp. CS-785/01]
MGRRQQPRNKKSRRWWFLGFLLFCALFLGGCVRYDLGVQFNGQYRGTIAQHIQLGEQITSFTEKELNQWLKTIEQRARKLDGKTKHLSNQEIVVTIPFSNGEEFVEKFNQFFNPTQQTPNQIATSEDIVQLNSQLGLYQSNLLLLERDKLNLDVDLRGLGMLSNEGSLVLNNASSLLNLEFTLTTPWGARIIQRSDTGIIPPITRQGNQVTWQLQPGEINHIEAVFWIPSWLGVGTIGIILLVLGGFYLKYKQFPNPNNPWVETQG